MHDTLTDRLYTLNWGARNTSIWQLNTTSPTGYSNPLNVVRNPSYFVDYQDCKFLGHPVYYQNRGVMLCAGIATYANNVTVGGIALVDEETMVPLSEVPITLTSDLGTPMTQNPVDVDLVNGTLRLYFLPDPHNATLYAFEPLSGSPYEY